MAGKGKYLFGPVPSRRLGLSLGVDITPLKTCTQNCIYCQLGVTGVQTVERKPYVPIEAVISELKEKVTAGLRADYITLSGSGEPTLNSEMGRLIDVIKEITTIPVAVLTNGTLLTDPAVRADCAKADVVLPSLDAGDEETFRKINCPHKDINFPAFVEGLCKFRAQYTGQIWLEVFFCEGINTSDEQIEKMRVLIERIRPDKVQLNTAVRPVADKSVICVGPARLRAIAERLGPNARVVADFSKLDRAPNVKATTEDVLQMLRRRPCSLNDVCNGLGVHLNEALKYLAHLEATGLIESQPAGGTVFFKAK
ncbi:MAG TPA: radical SAM protein [Planctomycetes bacterium]|nr:radical SAM protein [Planctomycetota bacterium]